METVATTIPANDDIAALVEQAKQGERDAYQALAKRFLRTAYAVALAQVGSLQDAEDVAQETLLTAFERIHSCRDGARFGGWIVQIARNRGINWRKKRNRLTLTDDPQPRGIPNAPDHDAAVCRLSLVEALTHISPLQREVVLLHDLEGWTHPEIGDALGISVAASRWHLFFARRVLRTRLGEPVSQGGQT